MNREIKCRAFNKESNTMHEVLSINFKHEIVILDMGWADKAQTKRWDSLFRFKDIELMQYTGLKDKNGVEIYEGDIVRVFMADNEYRIMVVSFSERLNAFTIYKHEDNLGTAMFYFDDYKVIGNIHENKELLGEK